MGKKKRRTTRRQPPSVFISSRMEELTMERRAAFEAIYDCGLVPLMFETEPEDDPRVQINTLVDRADFFLGIYDATLGVPSHDLCGLEPIVYELYRFLERWKIARGKATRRVVRDLDAEFSPGPRTPQLEALIQGVRGSKYADILKDRVLLVCRKSNGDKMVSSRLMEFSYELPRAIQKPCRGLTAKLPDGQQLYAPSHVDMYGVVF